MNMDFQLNYGLDLIKLSIILCFAYQIHISTNCMLDSFERKYCDNNVKSHKLQLLTNV